MVGEALATRAGLMDCIRQLEPGEDQLPRAIVPFDLIHMDDVPVDPDHVRALAKSIEEERPKRPKLINQGQLADITLAEVPGDPKFHITDGFHRSAALRSLDRQGAVATIYTGCTLDDITRHRILTATTHRSIRFSRLIRWIEEAWKRTSWADKIKTSQAFVLKSNKRMTGARIGLSSEEVVGIKQWVQDNCNGWGLTPGYVYQHILTGECADPKLVSQVRERANGHKLDALTPLHLYALAKVLPYDFERQSLIAEAVIEKMLTRKQTRVLAKAVVGKPLSEARGIIATGNWQVVTDKPILKATVPLPGSHVMREIANCTKDPLLEDELVIAFAQINDALSQGMPLSSPKMAGEKEVFDTLQKVLPDLPIVARRILTLHEIFGLSIQTITQILSVNSAIVDDALRTIQNAVRRKNAADKPRVPTGVDSRQRHRRNGREKSSIVRRSKKAPEIVDNSQSPFTEMEEFGLLVLLRSPDGEEIRAEHGVKNDIPYQRTMSELNKHYSKLKDQGQLDLKALDEAMSSLVVKLKRSAYKDRREFLKDATGQIKMMWSLFEKLSPENLITLIDKLYGLYSQN